MLMASVLYITYDGLLEPLGQSQVWQYLRRLSKAHRIVVVSFEKAEDIRDRRRTNAQKEDCERSGVIWVPLRYHKHPSAPATAYDMAAGMLVCLALVRRHGIQLVHARSYVPAVVALVLRRIFKLRFIFDMRGFWPDEKVESGSWRAGSVLYRAAKWFERRFLTEADVVVSLTHAGVAAMRTFPYLMARKQQFEVISTCTDLERFRPNPIKEKDATRPFTLGCVGSVGLWYLFDRMLECFVVLRRERSGARLLILNRDNHAYIRERLNAHRIPESSAELRSVDYTQVAEEINGMDAGMFFIKPIFSKTGSAPTKLGEFLACGVPCLANAGVGDYEAILEGNRVGVVLRDFSSEEKELGVKRLLELVADSGVRKRCVSTAHQHFSLEKAVESYDRIYRGLPPL